MMEGFVLDFLSERLQLEFPLDFAFEHMRDGASQSST